jgi:hypothetical protein
MSALRFSGWVMVLAGLGLGLRDALAPWLDHRNFHPISFGAVVAWSQIGPLLADLQRLSFRYLLEPVAGWLAMVWAFVVLLGLGGILLFIDRLSGGRRRRR